MHLFILSHHILPQGRATRIVSFKQNMRSTSEYPLIRRKGWFSRGICRVRSGPFGLLASTSIGTNGVGEAFQLGQPVLLLSLLPNSGVRSLDRRCSCC